MKANMGLIDRIMRIVAALIITVLYFTHIMSGMVAIILIVIASVFILTSFISFCPLYLPFGISTKKK
jgi:hypothetical protein